MTQHIVSIDDVSMLRDVKKTISLLRGVTAVKVSRKSEDKPNVATQQGAGTDRQLHWLP